MDVDWLQGSKHCDDYIDDETQPKCLRRYLRWHRWPAIYQFKAAMWKFKEPKLFADFEGKRVQLVMASRFGDVGITEDLKCYRGYNNRVMIDQLTNFSETP